MEDKGEDAQPRLYLLVCRHALVMLFAGLWLLSDGGRRAMCPEHESDPFSFSGTMIGKGVRFLSLP